MLTRLRIGLVLKFGKFCLYQIIRLFLKYFDVELVLIQTKKCRFDLDLVLLICLFFIDYLFHLLPKSVATVY